MKKQLGVNPCDSLSYDLHNNRQMPHRNAGRNGCLRGPWVTSPDGWESRMFAQQKGMQRGLPAGPQEGALGPTARSLSPPV